MASRFGMMYCATDWFGWASADVPNAAVALSDLLALSMADRPGPAGRVDSSISPG